MADHLGSAAVFAAADEVDAVATDVARIDLSDWVGVAGDACRDRLIGLCAELVRLRGDLRHVGRIAYGHELALAQAAAALSGGIR
ncbi:hypothetical protein [Pseudactinotalea sp. HY158]|uniref:hypothetical protein n=1 Tax=Pseudactinotalea sp. HY158 TaxID=2654547 RepID=UPI00129C2174|nr:hypothetical protein [Pseudactinotalea sp. HY158]QGH70757.1 hypothetical protein GCE65_15585 [Pseudactinotalea sp. HY158]